MPLPTRPRNPIVGSKPEPSLVRNTLRSAQPVLKQQTGNRLVHDRAVAPGPCPVRRHHGDTLGRAGDRHGPGWDRQRRRHGGLPRWPRGPPGRWPMAAPWSARCVRWRDGHGIRRRVACPCSVH